jgi:hypothetical protein
MTADELRTKIQGRLDKNIDSIADLIDDRKIAPGNRIKAFTALASRGGLPELKAVVTQNLSPKQGLEDLEEQKKSLLEEQKNIAGELEKLKAGGLEEAKFEQSAILPQPNDQEGA